MSERNAPDAKPRPIYFYVILAAALYALIHVYPVLSPILLSFLLILLISLAVNPVISRLRALTGGRKLATGLVAGGLVIVMILTSWAFFVPMKNSVAKLSEKLPAYWERLQKPLIKMEKQAVLSEQKIEAEVTTEIVREKATTGEHEAAQRALKSATPQKTKQEQGTLRSSMNQMVQNIAGGFTAVAFNAAQIVVVLVTVFFGVVFTLMNPRPIFGTLFAWMPERHHAQTLTIVQRIGKFVPGWVASTLLGMLTIGTLVFLVMWPIFGFMDALVLGLIALILEAIPYIGPMLAAVPAILFAIGKGGYAPLWVVFAYIAIQALENNVILPLIMARGMKLHPVAVIFSMLLCVGAFGVLGVLVAAPLVAVANILHDELYRKRFLPSVTDEDLDRLARKSLHEKVSEDK
jgi:predicted PurR-regulated permease PerM